MTAETFSRYADVLHTLTQDFVRAVPDAKWEFTPHAPDDVALPQPEHRIGRGFAPFCKQLRHVVCVRGVYNDALAHGRVDWARKHEHYDGPLTRDALLDRLDQHQRRLMGLLRDVAPDIRLDWDGTPFTFAHFTWEWIQHEAIHHGQWSVYASLAGFATPDSWRATWGL